MITIIVVVLVVAGVGGGVWYWQGKKVKDLQKQVEELKNQSTAGTTSTSQDNTKRSQIIPSDVVTNFLKAYLDSNGGGDSEKLANTSSFDNYVTSNFKNLIKKRINEMVEEGGPDPIIFAQDFPGPEGRKAVYEYIDSNYQTAIVIIKFEFKETGFFWDVVYILKNVNGLWKIDSNNSLR